MSNKIPDFTETELWVIRQAVAERFRKEVDIQQADAELRLDPGDRELTLCPVVYWREEKHSSSFSRPVYRPIATSSSIVCAINTESGTANTPTSASA